MKITPQIVTGIAPSCIGSKAGVVATALDTICPKYGIDNADIIHEFIARLCVECGEFSTFTENLNYSVTGLMETWPKRFPTVAVASAYARQPEKIANFVYANRLGNGGIESGDGWLFRGSGAIQLTGREIITHFTLYYNSKFGTTYTPEQMVQLLRTNLEISIHGACWFFAVAKRLIPLALSDKIIAIIKAINGGYIGKKETIIYYERAKKLIV